MEARETQAPEVQAQPAAAAPATALAPAIAPGRGRLTPAAVLALQRSAGNQAVGRAILARDLLDDVGNAIGDALDMRTDEERLDAEEDLTEFRAQTFAPLLSHQPPSGIGQFDVACDMAAGTLTITLKVAYEFANGNPAQVAAGYRPAEFQWTDPEKADWKARYQRDVSAQWSAHFPMHSTKPHWAAMIVNTTVNVVEDAAAPHFKVHVTKYPPDASMVQSSICPPGFHHDGTGNCAANAAGDGTGTADLDSNDLRPEQKLDWGNTVAPIQFREGSTALDATGTAALAPITTALVGHPEAHVELTGRASSTHRGGASAADGAIANMDLARARSGAVQAALLAAGATANQVMVRNEGENGAAADASWCRVDAQVGTHQTQDPGLHETGHMLGNDDEYTGTGAPAGSAVGAGYSGMITAQTGDVVTHADNEGAMSMGSTVQRWNYAAFLEALKAITHSNDWTL